METGRRMTVVQMLPALDSGGVEQGTLEVARYLAEQGHRSIVIAAGGRLAARLLEQGSEHLAWPVGEKRLATLRWVRRVRAFLAEERPDILHLRSRLPAWVGYLAWRRLKGPRPRLVTTVHGLYSVGRYSAVMVRGERIIAPSETVKEYIVSNYPRVDSTCIRVIPRGVDRRLYPYGYTPAQGWLNRWHSEHRELEGKYVVTLPGRLTRLKGHEDFLQVLSGLKAQGIRVHGLIAGGAAPNKRAYETELRRKVVAAGLDGEVSFLGHRGDLRDIMSVSDVVLSLSRVPESFGRTTLEALSLGVPVAGYAHGGVGEQLAAIFPEGCIPLGSTDGVVAKLKRWHASPPSIPAEHPFTLERMLSRTMDVYQELVSEQD